ncbi:hypothetical protein K788_0000216 [Paraburkholderia caribensis MBA4]|uniref:DUF6566 domain-containing protein n=1 Tax=Paraburkholderia caribensis MBA4 TaxID=1323664 RepID=A0A0P0RJ26_9BURK|nr:DUF6566 family protein [Paraburkholderia caribensis]ALL68764.1 hypothetical protein K788_0000216 [Paraburkholderia caribensis MBA4]
MQTHVFEHRGYEIAVHPERNAYGAWQATVSVRHAHSRVAEFRPETIQPEWLTQEEAVRDGIEWGMRFVDRKLNESHDLM